MRIGVLIGQFQPWTHVAQIVLERALQANDVVYVVIDKAHAPREPDHPWSYIEVVDMIFSSNLTTTGTLNVRPGAESTDIDVRATRIVSQVLRTPNADLKKDVVTCWLGTHEIPRSALPEDWVFENEIPNVQKDEKSAREMYFTNKLRFPDALADLVPTGTYARMQDWHNNVLYNDIRVRRWVAHG